MDWGPYTLASSRTLQAYSFSLVHMLSRRAGRMSYMCSWAVAGATALASSDQTRPVEPSKTTAADM